MRERKFDLAIIGGGPAGLFALFWARYHGLETAIFEASSRLGGQVRLLYPNVLLQNIPGYRSIRGDEFIANLINQLTQFRFSRYTSTRVSGVEPAGDGFTIRAGNRSFTACSVLFASGKGAFLNTGRNNSAKLIAEEHGFFLKPPPTHMARDQVVMVYGATTAALQWCRRVSNSARKVYLVNRLRSFAEKVSSGRLESRGVELIHSHDLSAIHDPGDGRKLVTLTSVHPPFVARDFAVDQLLLLGGMPANLRELSSYGLQTFGGGIQVDPATMESTVANCFAAGDAVFYPGKHFSMRTSFEEATRVVDEIVRRREGLRADGDSGSGQPLSGRA